MVFEFPDADEALHTAIRTPQDPEDPEFDMDGWPESPILEKDIRPGNYKREFAREHVEQLLKSPSVFVIAQNDRAAHYIADLRGIAAPRDGIFSELTGQRLDEEHKPETWMQARSELRTMLRYPHATERLTDFLVSHFGETSSAEGETEINPGKALNAVVEAVKTLIDPRVRAALSEGLSDEEKQEIFSHEDRLLEQAAEQALRNALKA
ncbi:hypothetical protein CCAX7_35790 [Capsulimonas corticalis]|uniref:Uncharacterized protein n=2 Tax=Capsulimonas corticalis TaxID=2219043 RepID=A0A402D619_9BACT|nr:hypothetical protein CCAX7_35790 [Capsulimonas corticalis]